MNGVFVDGVSVLGGGRWHTISDRAFLSVGFDDGRNSTSSGRWACYDYEYSRISLWYIRGLDSKVVFC
jgi:hypothetical protein